MASRYSQLQSGISLKQLRFWNTTQFQINYNRTKRNILNKSDIPDVLIQGYPLTINSTSQSILHSLSHNNNINAGTDAADKSLDLYQSIQPYADLVLCSSGTFYRDNSCLPCLISCQKCYQLTKCYQCKSNRKLFHGICTGLLNVSPKNGLVGQTVYNITLLNKNLIKGIEDIDKKTSFELIYPSGKKVQFPYRQNFTVPIDNSLSLQTTHALQIKLNLINVNSDGSIENLLSVIFNSAQRSLDKVDLSKPDSYKKLAGAKKTVIPPSQPNQCGCSQNGICNLQTLYCECKTGYEGNKCQYTSQQYQSISNSVSNYIENLKMNANASSKQKIDAIAEVVPNLGEFLTSQSTKDLVSILSSQFTDNASEITQQLNEKILEASGELIQKINQNSKISSKDTQQVIDLITKSAQVVILPNVTFANPYKFKSAKIQTQAILVDKNADSQISLDGGSSFQLPRSSVANIGSQQAKFLTIGFISNPFKDLTPNTLQLTSNIVQASVFVSDKKIDFKNPIIIENKIDRNLVVDQPPLCLFMNTNRFKWSAQGCSFTSHSIGKIVCTCTHTTTFGSFLNKGFSVLAQSNFDAILALKDLTLQDLKTNIGFYFSLGYIFLYILIGSILYCCDRSKMKHNYNELVVKQFFLRENCSKRRNSKAKLYIKRKKTITDGTKQTFNDTNYNTGQTQQSEFQSKKLRKKKRGKNKKNKRIKVAPTLVDEPNQQQLDDQQSDFRAINQPPKQLKTLETTERYNTGRSSITENPILTENQDLRASDRNLIEVKQFSTSKRTKITQRLRREKNEPCCKFLCSKSLSQIKNNNLVINFISVTSVINPRCLRMSMFFLGALLQISMCALFFNLSPSQGEDDSSFIDSIIENFWVGLYSAVFVMIPMLIIGLCLTFPSKYRKQIEETHMDEKMKKFMVLMKKFKILIFFGYIFFWLMSIFLCLYLIAFSKVASQKMSKQWMYSSSVSLFVDVILAQVVPAFLVSFIALLASCSKSCKWLIILAIVIEIYRHYRNLTQG